MSLHPMRFSPLVRRAFALAVAAATLASSPLAAQEPTAIPATHTVKKGDTLWDIAKMYLNDPFLWPEIYRLNTAIVEDPHWIYPGEVLTLPGGTPQVAENPGGGAQVVSEDQMEQPAAPIAEAPRQPVGSTVFAAANRKRTISASRFGGTANTYQHTAVRAAEFYSAPWLDSSAGPPNTGRIIRTANVPGEVRGVQRDKFNINDYVFVTLPKGVVAAKGDQFLVFEMLADLGNGTKVMRPTGQVKIISIEGTDAAMALITNFYQEVWVGQQIMPLEHFAMNPDARPAPLLLGTEGKVVFIPPAVTIASAQDWIILNVGLKDGVKIGDQFTVYRPSFKQPQEHGPDVTIPEGLIGRVQVIKVTELGATALVTDIRNPAIFADASVRLTARMP
jgi:LysM repeat protein